MPDQIPAGLIGALYVAIGTLGTVIGYLFKLLIESNTQRHAETLKHHDEFAKAANEDRKEEWKIIDGIRWSMDIFNRVRLMEIAASPTVSNLLKENITEMIQEIEAKEKARNRQKESP